MCRALGEKMSMTEHKSEADIKADLQIGSDLEEEFEKQAPRYAYWSFQKARADAEVRRAEEDMEVMWAALYSDYKNDNPTSKENEVKAHIFSHPDYKAKRRAFNDAKYDADIFKACVRALEAKASMLQQLGPMNRQERDAYLRSRPAAKLEVPKPKRTKKQSENRRERIKEATATIKKKQKAKREQHG